MWNFLTLLAQQPSGDGGQSSSMMSPVIILALVMLFLFIVVFPAQRRQKKEQEKLIATLKRGAKVLTSGGIVGIVTSVKDGDDEIVIRSEETKLRIKRNVVVQILGSDESEANKTT